MVLVRTTIDIPDRIYRDLKARAARQGSTVKELILRGVEKEMGEAAPKRTRVQLPLIRGKGGRKLDLTNAQIDEILFG
jgi:hypothetical protein